LRGWPPWGRPPQAIAKAKSDDFMIDLIYVAAVALIFVVGELYAWWCEKL